MDWGLIISGAAGMFAGGGISWLFRIREDKAASKTDIIANSAVAMEKLINITTQQSTAFEEILRKKDELIAQQASLIDEFRISLDKANQKIKYFEYKVSENERKISGMQKMINAETKERRAAEKDVCFVDDCNIREPERGTYKKDKLNISGNEDK